MEKKEKKDNDCGCKKTKSNEPKFFKRIMREIREKMIRK
tara:strand:+ start:50 stop:166 length:117 start_codon:yes stop_codon:yes gene_type:complete